MRTAFYRFSAQEDDREVVEDVGGSGGMFLRAIVTGANPAIQRCCKRKRPLSIAVAYQWAMDCRSERESI